MMRKLPKQHLLGLALALVGAGAFLGIQISDIANQQTYASWASNDDLIDDVFRAGTPSTGDIIDALFGDGNGGSDTGFYTQHWSSNSCNTGAMSVVNLSPGTNTIPTSLSGNTVYVLDVGTYTMTGIITFDGNCSAIVGKSAGMSTAHITSNNVQGINITNRDNIIVASIEIEQSVVGNDIGIATYDSTNSSIWPINVISWDEAIYMENSSFIFVGGSASGNRLGIGVQNNSNDIYIGETGPDNITSLIGNEIGLEIADSDHVYVYNTVSNTNVYLGGMVVDSSDILIGESIFGGNSVGFGLAGLRLSGSQNINISGGSYNANEGPGIWAQYIVGLTGNGFAASTNFGGTGYGMYLDNVQNLALSNIIAVANTKTNIHVTGSQNISFTNLISTGSAENGIQAINTTDLSLLGGSFHQNTYHGIFLDAGASGAVVSNVTANLNTLAGINIANSANYNTVTSSAVSQNGVNGIIILDSHDNTISGSTVTDTVTSAGITIYGANSYNNTIAYTTAAQSVAGPGIVMVGGNNNLVTHSIAYENNGVGMGIAGMGISQNDSYNNTIAYSTSYNNIGYGGFGLSLDQVNNTLHHLYAYGNDTDGITIYTAGTGVNYVHDVYTYANLDNGVYIRESENISGYNIHTYENEMNGVRLSNTADYNQLSFVEAYDNGLNGIEVSDSASNLFENIVSFDNTNEGVYLVLKSDSNTFNNMQLYNNRIGFRQSSASANKATLANALVYNNSSAGVSLGGSSIINNAAIYNNVTGLTLQGSANVANNVDVYNNEYGIYMTPGAMSASGVLNNVAVYNNTVGITAISSQNNTYNGLHMFDNDTPFVGTNASDAQLASTIALSRSIPLANNLTDTGFMTCNWAVQSTNNAAQNLLVYPYCDTRGQIGGWTPTLAVQYTFFPYIYKQQQPVRYVTGTTIGNTGTAITGMFVGDFAYSGSTDFGGHMNLTNEGTTYASGGFTYRYDNGPFDIEMNANTGTTKGFVVTGVNDILWDGVAGSLGSFASTQYYLYAEYLVPGNGLKIFRAGYDITGQGLVSNYYGQIRGIAAPVCGDAVVEYNETCDDGDTDDNDGCNSTCQIEHRDCSWFSGRTSTGFVPHNITVSIVSGLYMSPYSFDDIIWGDSTPNGNITTGNTHTYMTGGNYTGSIQVTTQFSLVSAVQTTCEFPVTAIDPTYCGDGITQTPNGSGFNELCDLGSGLNGDGINGCTNTCTYADPLCTLVSTPTTGYAPLNVNIVGVLTDAVLVSLDYGDGTTGASINTNHIYTGVGATYTPLMTVANPINPMMTTQCADKIDTLDVACGNSIVDPGEQCDLGITNGNGISGCSSQCATEPICQLMISPGFVISDYQTTPYQVTGEILQTIIFTSTTTSVNPIVTYEWNITYSGTYLGGMNSPLVFDNALISGANDQSTVELDFSAYSGIVDRPFMRVTLTVTDSSGYQAEYQTPFIRSDVTTSGARYWIMGQTIIDSNFSGFALSVTGEMLSSIAMSGGVVSGNNFMRPDAPIGIPHPVNIDRENNGSNEELFMYTSPYAYTNTYSTGLYTLLVGTNFGNTGQYSNLSHRTYPVACAVSCGNGSTEINEQCDDGNLNNNDGCSDVCLLEIAPTCGDGVVNQQNEQCDDGNSDEYDGCSTQCITNSCTTSYQTILEPKFSFVTTGWTGDETIDINFVSTTTGSGLTYNWSIGQFSGYSGLTGSNLSGWSISGATNTSTFGLHIDVTTTPYTIVGTVRLDVSNGSHSGSVQGYLVCTNDMINNTYPGCSMYSAYQEVQSFSGLTLTLDDRSIVQVLSKTGATQTINQYTEVGFNNLIPKRWYRDHPTMTPFTSLTGAYASGSHTYASGYGVIKPYFTRGLTYLTEPDLRKDYAYQQSVFGYTNSCFSECGNGIIEAISGPQNYITGISYLVVNATTGTSYYYTGIGTGYIVDLQVVISGSAVASGYSWNLTGGNNTGSSATGFIIGSTTGSTITLFGMEDPLDDSWTEGLEIEVVTNSGDVLTILGIVTAGDSGLVIIYPTSDIVSTNNTLMSRGEVYLGAAGYHSGTLHVHTGVGFDAFDLDYSQYYIGYDWENDDNYDFTGVNQPVVHLFATGNQSIIYEVSIASSGGNSGDMNLDIGLLGQNVLLQTVYSGSQQYEQCDDGNQNEYDGCTSQCTLGTIGICGNGTIETIGGSTTSGTIDYVISSSIAMLTGYDAYDNTYLTGWISVYGATLSTGTAVSYQWTFSGFSTGGANTGFIVGSSTGSTVSIFDDAYGVDSDLEGTLTLEITDAEGNIISTQSYLILDFDTVAIVGMGVGTITISGSQVIYSDYEIYISSVQNGGTTINTTSNTTSGSRTGLFGNQGWAGYDRYNDGIYDYTEQGTGQVVSYTYNITGGNITSDVTFFFSGFAMNMPILRNPGGISQGYVLHTTPGVVVGGTGERCDDGNLIDGDGCSSVCDQETPSCNWFTTTSQTGNVPHNFTISVLPNIYTTGYIFNPIQWMVGVLGSATGDVFTNNTYTYTGIGSYTARVRVVTPVGPNPDTATILNCSRPVTVSSSCGNFIVEGNEQCDDGDTDDNDGCDSQCNFEIPQTCGLSGNLVPNPGFESYTQCTTSYGQFSGYVASWYGSLGGDPDYGNANCPYGTTGLFSYVDQYPHLGSSGMVNILTYASNIPNGGVEYVGAELTAPMQIGNYYDVGFCFATHIRSNYITDSLGMLFSTGASPTNIGWQAILETPQFEHIGYAQGTGWTCVSGTVYADQAYERFLIGSFHTNTGQNMIPNPIYSGNGLNYTVANYVIDDVFVSEKCATCGDGLQAQSEQCDLGTGNAVSCTPGYGQTCNYCSLSCTTGTQTGAYCGDTIVSQNDGEQCDDGNQNNTDGCNNSCQRTQPTCTLLLTPSAGSYPLNVLFSLNMNAGSSLIHMNYGDGTTGTSVTGHTYTTGGLFMPTAYIQNSSNTGLTAICPANTVITVTSGYTPVCGNAIVDTGSNEVCDLGTGNATSCTPGYGQSCNYCSLTCTTGTVAGPYCGDNIKNGNEECDGGSGCRSNCTKSGGGGTSGPTKDKCDGKDESPSYYDGKCEGAPQHSAAPVGRACKYSDEQYLARGPFMDTLTHRALPYTEMMRASCMWRGRDTDEGKWNANPNENITVAEVLKTFVKLQGVAFDDFDIKTENARYPKATPFADVPQDHWFAWYADYAVKKGLTQGLVTSKDGKNYLDPDRHITRNDAVKFMMITYEAINKKKTTIDGASVLGDVVNSSDPYYQYIRKAEALGFISGVKQKDGSYRFDGKRSITRAEFAKIASVPFNDQLFDTSSLVLNSPVYKAIVSALDKVRGDKIEFIQTLLLNMNNISDTQFIKKFKVTKAIFIQELRNAILPGLYEDASSDD